MEGEDRTFRVNFSTEGVSTLRDVVMGKLKEFMGDYTDDTLVDYVIVLLKNGRRKDEAKNELDVFLGDDSDPFISWLWDHLRSNLGLYVKKQDLHIDIEPNEELVAQKQGGKSIIDAKKRNSDRNHPQENKIPEKNGDETAVSHSNKITTIGKKRSHTESHREDIRMKESISPRRNLDKERWQAEEKHRRKRDVLPVSVSAPRRLLQFAVRDAVATSGPSLKRLRSVVTKTTEDTLAEEPPKRSRNISMSVAIKAVAEAANDVLKARQSRNVFHRVGHGTDFPNTPSSQDFGFAAEGTVGEYNSSAMADLQSGYHVQSNDSRLHFHNMFSDHHRVENDQEDDVFDMKEGETRDISQLGFVSGNFVENSQVFVHSYSSTSNEALHGPHKGSVRLEALANNYTRNASPLSMNSKKPHRREERDTSESRKHVGDNLFTKIEAMLNKSRTPVVAFNGNVQSDTSPQKSQSQVGSRHTVIPEEDADSRTIFVSNVHFAASKDSLSRHFNKFGDVLKVTISLAPSTGQPQGSAYIEFISKSAAELALSMNGTSFMSRILKVVKKSSAQPEATSISTRSHFPVHSFGRGIPNPYRSRLPVKSGSRSFQWKRGSDSNVTGNAAQSSGSKLPPTRSFTYVRDVNQGNA